MERTSAAAKFFASRPRGAAGSSPWVADKTAKAIGSIITVVAELLTHIEMKAVTAMSANNNAPGEEPTRDTTDKATRRCRPQRSNARPSIAPPRIRNITGDMYCAATASGLAMPSSGNARNGRLPVRATGTASVNHQQAINTVSAATLQPSAERPAGAGIARIDANNAMPSQNPLRPMLMRRNSLP